MMLALKRLYVLENENEKLRNAFSSLYQKFSMRNENFERKLSRQIFDFSRKGLGYNSLSSNTSSFFSPYPHIQNV